MNKAEWIDLLKKSRFNIQYGYVKDLFLNEWRASSSVGDMFVRDVLNQLHHPSPIATEALVKVLNENTLKDYSVETIFKKWNNSKSPVRNFLLVTFIDYPIE
jgi:hypothetical protein